MPDSIFRIWSIARYEAKVVMRGWLFRTAFLLPLAFLLAFSLTSIFRSQSAYSFFLAFYRVPAVIPWLLMTFFTVYACAVLAAEATNSGSSEYRLDTLDAVRVRPWSNIEYVAGKQLGQMICFGLMMISVELFMLGIVIIDPRLFVVGSGWLLYPPMICIPAFVFMSGLSLLTSTIIRNQMFSLMMVTAVLIFSMLVGGRYFHLLDITAFHMPLFRSGITGFAFSDQILSQRLVFLAGGFSMVLVSALAFSRQPGRRLDILVLPVCAFLIGIGALGAGYYYGDYFRSGIKLRKEIREVSREYRPVQRIKALNYNINLSYDVKGIESAAEIVLKNASSDPADRYIFTLNPGLEVTSVSGISGPLEFDRESHILKVYPYVSLNPGETDSIEVSYRGYVDERAMFSDIHERIRCSDISMAELSAMSPFAAFKLIRIRRELAPQGRDYALLVPDAMWYPVPGLPYDPGYALDDHRDFATYRMEVRLLEGLAAVSQGERRVGENSEFIFEPEYALPGITLAVGRFRTRTLEVDSVFFSIHSTPISEDLLQYITMVSDTIPGIIAEKKDLLEYSMGLKYPFGRFSCLEVPASFCPFRRPMRASGSGYAEPEIFLVHENGMNSGLSDYGFRRYQNRRPRGIDRENSPGSRRYWTIKAASGFMHLLGEREIFNVSPMFFRHVTWIEPSRCPYLGLLMDYSVGMEAVYREQERSSLKDIVYSSSERASRFLYDGIFLAEVLDPANYRSSENLLNAWASHQYYLVDAKSENGAFSRFIRDLVAENPFSIIGEREFLDKFAGRFGFGLESILVDLENPSVIPGYLISGHSCCSFIEGERERFRLGFDVSNLEETAGVIAVSGALRYSGTHLRRPKRKLKNPVLSVEAFGPGESRRVEFEVDGKPMTIWINTNISRNVPSRITWGPGIEVRPSCMQRMEKEHIVHPSDFHEESLVVDDLDPGFDVDGGNEEGFLVKLLPFAGGRKEYANIKKVHRKPPSNWSRIIYRDFFGKYTKTAMCLRAGEGNARAVWRIRIPEPGFYDVFAFIYDHKRKLNSRDRIKYGFDRIEYHYTVHHSDGTSEAVVMPDKCEDGWTLIGRYYFDEGETAVELSDESPALYIIADAVKWVKVN